MSPLMYVALKQIFKENPDALSNINVHFFSVAIVHFRLNCTRHDKEFCAIWRKLQIMNLRTEVRSGLGKTFLHMNARSRCRQAPKF